MADYGDAVVQAHYGPDGKIERLEVLRADWVIGITRELLAHRDESGITPLPAPEYVWPPGSVPATRDDGREP